MNRHTCPSRRCRAKVTWGNPCYPDYSLLDDHGWVIATACGSRFKVATVREMFTRLVQDGFHPDATLDLDALTDDLDTRTR